MSIAPLYIAGSTERHVVRDGPGIVIRQEGAAVRRYPFSRLSKVVSDHRVSWRTDALTGCMMHGVPVYFSDGRGVYLGACYGTRRRETTLGNLLRLTLDSPDALNCFNDLLLALENDARQRCAEQHDLRGRLSDPKVVVSGATNQIFSVWHVPPGSYLRAYECLLRSWLETELLNFLGSDSELIAYPVAGFHLGERLAAICQWDMLIVLASDELTPIADESPVLWAGRIFHRNLIVHARALGRMIGRIEAALRARVL